MISVGSVSLSSSLSVFWWFVCPSYQTSKNSGANTRRFSFVWKSSRSGKRNERRQSGTWFSSSALRRSVAMNYANLLCMVMVYWFRVQFPSIPFLWWVSHFASPANSKRDELYSRSWIKGSIPLWLWYSMTPFMKHETRCISSQGWALDDIILEDGDARPHRYPTAVITAVQTAPHERLWWFPFVIWVATRYRPQSIFQHTLPISNKTQLKCKPWKALFYSGCSSNHACCVCSDLSSEEKKRFILPSLNQCLKETFLSSSRPFRAFKSSRTFAIAPSIRCGVARGCWFQTVNSFPPLLFRETSQLPLHMQRTHRLFGPLAQYPLLQRNHMGFASQVLPWPDQ